MKKFLALSTIGVLAALISTQSGFAQEDLGKYKVLEIMVVDGDNPGEVIEDAGIRLRSTFTQETETGEDGVASLVVPVGVQGKLSISAIGYQAREIKVRDITNIGKKIAVVYLYSNGGDRVETYDFKFRVVNLNVSDSPLKGAMALFIGTSTGDFTDENGLVSVALSSKEAKGKSIKIALEGYETASFKLTPSMRNGVTDVYLTPVSK
ncbi:MAG: hypothetical protein KDD52_00505 [Bdellovibrionales bacterium]|nr:hypothetical protein [Bdellovibrionales bacterium]